MLILYLDSIGRGNGIDYRGLVSDYNLKKDIDDPCGFLKDPNNWVPNRVLKNLIKEAEIASGNKNVTYLAAKDYFKKRAAPSLLEIIVRIIHDIEQILHCSHLWAGGYTNYLRLQTIKPSISNTSEIILLSRFDDAVEPMIGSINLIRGNYEGFISLFEDIEDASCIEEFSQLRLETIVREFDGYHIEKDRDSISIIDSSTLKEVILAKSIHLRSQDIGITDKCPDTIEDIIVKPSDGRVNLLSVDIEDDKRLWSKENSAYKVVKGGELRTGSLTYTIETGMIFNAPYSRYRYSWRHRSDPTDPNTRTGKIRDLNEIIPLLFDHLKAIRETQKRQLGFFIEKRRLEREKEELKTSIERDFGFYGMIGRCQQMEELFKQVSLVARTDSTVLITGETGTGKELLAKAIHLLSPRGMERFYAINCTALPKDILEAELFGYEKGAFTGAVSTKKGIFESVNGGTLFLDEVGDIPIPMQAKLLRVIEEREIQRVGGRQTIPIDVRIIAATNRDLKDLVKSGEFRKDLYYRLNVITLNVPPLRERVEDILLLVDHYIEFYSRKNRKPKIGITRDALKMLQSHTWPGNIRELKNVIERAVVLDQDGNITSDDISIERAMDTQPPPPTEQPFHTAVADYKRHVIEEALKKTNGNRTKAAELLGLQRTYLSRLLKELKIKENP